MITDSMKLNSATDADQWASEFSLENDDQIAKLSDWLWNNKPYIGCTYKDHPISSLSFEELWDIVE